MPRNGRGTRLVARYWIGAGFDAPLTFTAATIQPGAAMDATASETITMTVGPVQTAAVIDATVPTNFTLEVATTQAVPSFSATASTAEASPRRTRWRGYNASVRETMSYLGLASRKDPRRAP